jgi:hypothetical protein
MATGGGKRGYISQFFSDRVFVACLDVDFFQVPELLIALQTGLELHPPMHGPFVCFPHGLTFNTLIYCRNLAIIVTSRVSGAHQQSKFEFVRHG